MHVLLNDKLIVYIRLWSGPDQEQKIVDEISGYISAADADLEVTTPFEYIESFSSQTNKLRVAILLANEALFSDNKDKYLQGFELAAVYKNKNEVSFTSVGRFSIFAEKKGKKFSIYAHGGYMDDNVLLPTALLGIEKTPDMQCASVSAKDLDSIIIESLYDSHTYWKSIINNFTD